MPYSGSGPRPCAKSSSPASSACPFANFDASSAAAARPSDTGSMMSTSHSLNLETHRPGDAAHATRAGEPASARLKPLPRHGFRTGRLHAGAPTCGRTGRTERFMTCPPVFSSRPATGDRSAVAPTDLVYRRDRTPAPCQGPDAPHGGERPSTHVEQRCVRPHLGLPGLWAIEATDRPVTSHRRPIRDESSGTAVVITVRRSGMRLGRYPCSPLLERTWSCRSHCNRTRSTGAKCPPFPQREYALHTPLPLSFNRHRTTRIRISGLSSDGASTRRVKH